MHTSVLTHTTSTPLHLVFKIEIFVGHSDLLEGGGSLTVMARCLLAPVLFAICVTEKDLKWVSLSRRCSAAVEEAGGALSIFFVGFFDAKHDNTHSYFSSYMAASLNTFSLFCFSAFNYPSRIL